jgi:hypothetical protein
MGKAPVTKACSTRECCLLQLFLIPVYITHGRLPALNKTKSPGRWDRGEVRNLA